MALLPPLTNDPNVKKYGYYFICALAAILCLWVIKDPDLVRDPAYGFKFVASISELVLHNPRLAQREYSEAIRLYSNNTLIRPTSLMRAAAYNNRAWVRALTATTRQQYMAALEDCNRAINYDHYLINAYDTRSYVYAKLGIYDDAIADTKTAIEQNSDKVLKDWNGAIATYSEDAYSYALRGLVHLELHDHKKANDDLNKAIELDPGCAAAKYFQTTPNL